MDNITLHLWSPILFFLRAKFVCLHAQSCFHDSACQIRKYLTNYYVGKEYKETTIKLIMILVFNADHDAGITKENSADLTFG